MPNPQLPDLLLAIYRLLLKAYGPQACFLHYRNPLQLLVSAILSAQCTDVRVNQITPKLFAVYPDAASFAEAEPEAVGKLIRSAGLYRHKAKNIVNSCRMMMQDYEGQIPRTMAELVKLPGIGRKTANVIRGHAFQVPGFPVDTHVNRVLNRIGLVKTKDPVKIEMQVNKSLPKQYWTEFSLLLIRHGRQRCPARKPGCKGCEICRLCHQVGL